MRQPRTKLDDARSRLPVAEDVARRANQLARELRRRATPSEELLWNALRARHLHGMKFRRQQAIEATGMRFVRVTAEIVVSDLTAALRTIESALETK